jgi:phosphoribosylamine--glycine ligase
MRVLILDTGLALDLARRLAAEGDEVYYYLNKIRNYPDESEAIYGKGLFEEWGVKRIDMYESVLSYVDYVIATDIGYGKHLDHFRAKGTLVYGAPFLGERLETDREFGRETLAGYGVKVPEVTVHNTKEDAVQHIKKDPGGYAYKSDESRNKKTFVTKSPEAMIKFLAGLSSSAPIRLEKFIDGVEIAVGGFFNGQEFLGPKLTSFEYNKTFPGDLGPMNSEIGTAMYYDETGGKAFAETLTKIEPFLRMVGYRGYVEVSCIVNENGTHVIEFTNRFGYPVYMIQMTLHKRFGEVLSSVAYGTLLDPRFRPKWDILKRRWAIGTCWCVNGYPYTEVMKARGGDWSIVYGIDKAIKEGSRVGFFGVVKEDGKYIALPDYGRTVCITGQGQTISQAMQEMNDSARKIWIPDGFYRYDIGARTIAEGQKLLEWGYVDKDWAKSFR